MLSRCKRKNWGEADNNVELGSTLFNWTLQREWAFGKTIHLPCCCSTESHGQISLHILVFPAVLNANVEFGLGLFISSLHCHLLP